MNPESQRPDPDPEAVRRQRERLLREPDDTPRWRPNFSRQRHRTTIWMLLGPGFVAMGIVAVLFMMASRLTRDIGSVVVYIAQDQVYAEPLLRAAELETRLRIKPVFDSEAVKTVGLANRLLAERGNPRSDVFWNNEELRTQQLLAAGVLSTNPPPLALGYRSRRIVINTNRVSLADAPASLAALTNAAWSGRVALAYPLFGTTATHFHALRQAWGEPAWRAWCQALVANRSLVVDGNSVVVRLVGQGQADIGLTDSDDIAAGQREGLPVAALPLGEDSLLIPNTVTLVRGGPHPIEARKFLAHLQRPEVLRQLVQAGALEGVSTNEVTIRTLQPDWPALLRDLDVTTRELQSIFLR